VANVTKPARPTVGREQGHAEQKTAGSPGARPTAALLDVNSPRWSAFLAEASHDFYHLPAYAAVCATQEGGEPRAVLVEHGRRKMLLPLIIRPVPGDRHDAVSPYGYPGALYSGPDDPRFVVEALRTGLDALSESGVVAVFVRLNPLVNTSPLTGIGTVVEHGKTVSIDLTLSDEDRWRQMRANHRRDISRALSLGWAARRDETWEHWATFRRLYHATMERHGAARFYFFDDRYFDRLRDALGERLHLWVAQKDGTVAAAALFTETCGVVQYHLSGLDWSFTRAHPTKLLIHGVAGWARERGNRRLHLGGGVAGAEDSLFHFKAGFSPLRHRFRTLRVVLDEAEYGRLVAARDPTLDLTRQTGFFPPYRTR
jgi:Acetyltransferase (GNAT) domain